MGCSPCPRYLQLSLLPVIFALFMTDFFDTMGTMIAVGQEGKLLDEDGRVPQAKRILLSMRWRLSSAAPWARAL